jgi:hypothetical protein
MKLFTSGHPTNNNKTYIKDENITILKHTYLCVYASVYAHDACFSFLDSDFSIVRQCSPMQISVATRSKAWVCRSSLAGIVSSNPPGVMDVWLL